MVEARRIGNAQLEQQAWRSEAEVICLKIERDVLSLPEACCHGEVAKLVCLFSNAEVELRQQMHVLEQQCLALDARLVQLNLSLVFRS